MYLYTVTGAVGEEGYLDLAKSGDLTGKNAQKEASPSMQTGNASFLFSCFLFFFSSGSFQ